jgi:hypothetical protein
VTVHLLNQKKRKPGKQSAHPRIFCSWTNSQGHIRGALTSGRHIRSAIFFGRRRC